MIGERRLYPDIDLMFHVKDKPSDFDNIKLGDTYKGGTIVQKYLRDGRRVNICRSRLPENCRICTFKLNSEKCLFPAST